MSSEKKPKKTMYNQCYSCVHRREIPGDCHTRCSAKWESRSEMPKGHRVGVEGGWWRFPGNFDPTWHTADCGRYQTQPETS